MVDLRYALELIYPVFAGSLTQEALRNNHWPTLALVFWFCHRAL